MIIYFTNIEIKNKDKIIDEIFDNYQINLRILDLHGIADSANNSHATRHVIDNFIKNHLRSYQKPGEGLIISDYLKNPKLYVFLMHQINQSSEIKNLNHELIDTLILFSLRDTDPDDDLFLSSSEIVNEVKNLLNFEIEKIQSKVNRRLKVLSKKPDRKVNHHTKIDKYCLPYNTRLKIISNNANDKALYNAFHAEAEGILKKNLKAESINIKNIPDLLHKTLEKIFYSQGLEFADFLLNSGCGDTFEGNLGDTVDEILHEVSINEQNFNKVKDLLIISIRDIIYHGSKDAKQYLNSLSKTYLVPERKPPI